MLLFQLDFEESKFQAVAKFEMFEKLRDSQENKDLLMTLFRESKHKIDHLKGLLKDVEIERYQLKHRLGMTKEKEKGMKIMVYGLLFVLAFWKGVMRVCHTPFLTKKNINLSLKGFLLLSDKNKNLFRKGLFIFKTQSRHMA